MTFKHEENEKIGEYLSNLINGKYKTQRQFCIAYLLHSGMPTDDYEVNKMANRISQIIKGKKALQTYDLPIFTQLLDVSCEEILSAGESHIPKFTRKTNYSVAFSKNPAEWEEYINRNDNLILNEDEYCKTILDYAYEFKNYELVKYLLDKDIIWFHKEETTARGKKYFSSGTSIKRRSFFERDNALIKELHKANMRCRIIELATDNNDLDLLDRMHAKEIPNMLEYAKYEFPQTQPEDDTVDETIKNRLVNHIAKADKKTLDYFTDEIIFKWKDLKTSEETTRHFVFAYYSELLNLLIKNNSEYAETALKKAIKHNNSSYKRLIKALKNYKANLLANYSSELENNNKEIFSRYATIRLKFSDDKTMFYYNFIYKESGNLVKAEVEKPSKDPHINNLIKELSLSYDKVATINEQINSLEFYRSL